MSEDTHGSAPLPAVNPEPIHAAVDALAAALHEYADAAVGVRAEFGAAEADEDPRILAMETAIGELNGHLFDAMHDALGMHPDLTSTVWESPADGAEVPGGSAAAGAEQFYLGFIVARPPGIADPTLDGVIDLLDDVGTQAVERLAETGFDVLEWVASRGMAAGFEGYGEGEPEEDG